MGERRGEVDRARGRGEAPGTHIRLTEIHARVREAAPSTENKLHRVVAVADVQRAGAQPAPRLPRFSPSMPRVAKEKSTAPNDSTAHAGIDVDFGPERADTFRRDLKNGSPANSNAVPAFGLTPAA